MSSMNESKSHQRDVAYDSTITAKITLDATVSNGRRKNLSLCMAAWERIVFPAPSQGIYN